MKIFKLMRHSYMPVCTITSVEYWIRFEWNKHRCTYVHWRIYSSRWSGYIAGHLGSEILIGKYTGIYTHAIIAWAMWEMLLKSIDSEELIELIAWETVKCENCHSIVCFAPNTCKWVLMVISIHSMLIKQWEKLLNVVSGVSTFTWHDGRWN